jgi:hypothetical protein
MICAFVRVIHVYIRKYVHAHAYTQMHPYMRVCIPTYIHAYMHKNTQTHTYNIHTYTHTLQKIHRSFLHTIKHVIHTHSEAHIRIHACRPFQHPLLVVVVLRRCITLTYRASSSQRNPIVSTQKLLDCVLNQTSCDRQQTCREHGLLNQFQTNCMF